MSSSAPYGHSASSSIAQRPVAYRAPGPTHNGPPGTFAPGTKVQVGGHRVVIEKYLSEGGFAHVYVVRVPKAPNTPEVAVLKRVAVPDKEALANMRTEVETMKKLKGHKHIVTYIDSHASVLKGGGYEVFLLMEYCSGGGLIDFMNTRLQHRLTEPEILHIFSDVAEGVATMHYLKPPLLHRDLKVENVLITSVGNQRIYKICDFGSTAPPRPAATSAAEGRLIEDDVQRHTTLQYRSPEMIDVYRKQPIDEKSDIWALGVLLYKLCYYTTPFEEQGQMAILNATFKFPPYPQFSDRIKKLIAWMLCENPQHRPNIYQVVVEVCSMRHRNIPIKDIYSHRTPSEARRNQQLPSPEPHVASPPVVGLQKVAPVQKVQTIPDITPMRRGRPTAPGQQPVVAKPSPSPMRGTTSDPFAALDSQDVKVRSAAADELASRFPSLDEFSLLHDRGATFEFGQSPAPDAQQELSKRVTEALADDAFNIPATKTTLPPKPQPVAPASADIPKSTPTAKPSTFENDPERRSNSVLIHQPSPQRPSMVSTGIQTSPAPSPPPKNIEISNRPIWRVPSPKHHHRALSQSRIVEKQAPLTGPLKPEFTLPPRPSLLGSSRSRSQSSLLMIPKSPASSRPSLESQRPSALDLGDVIGRSKSANSRPRPTSVHVESSLDYLRDREAFSRPFTPGGSRVRPSSAAPSSGSDADDKKIKSNVEFLRSMESEDSQNKKLHRRTSSQSKHSKRSSLPSISLGNTKSIVKGKFGDAFRRFENNSSSSNKEPTTPKDQFIDRSNALTPIAGSEATGGPSDDERGLDETEDLPPEVRREMERRRLSQEEKRVAAAAAEYRQRISEQGEGGKGKAGPTRAATIQHRVKSLLDDTKHVATTRTAEGYGKYTDDRKALPPRPDEQIKALPLIARKPVKPSSSIQASPRTSLTEFSQQARPTSSASSVMRPPTSGSMRPSAPPKPMALRTGGQFDAAGKVPPQTGGRDKPLPVPVADADATDDWDMASFSKRYPSLSGLEMVETEIGYANEKIKGKMSVRDV